jgi:hypothetical protein
MNKLKNGVTRKSTERRNVCGVCVVLKFCDK